MSSLSKRTQKVIMKNLSNRRLETTDYWEYAVSTSWLDNWNDVLSSANDGADNDAIGDRSIVKPVNMATDDAENQYLPESQWRIYVSWFGLDSKHELRRRPIFSKYLSLESTMNLSGEFVIADNELDFLPIYSNLMDELMMSSDDHKMLSVYAWDSFAFICKQLKSVLAIKKTTSVRLWLCLLGCDSSSGPVIIEPVMVEDQTFLSKLIEILPDVRLIMKQRNTQIHPKYITKGKEKDIERRRPLWDDVRVALKANKPCFAVGVEIIGRNARKCDEDEMLDSIVTISSISNEWEDILTQHVEKYTDDMSRCTDILKDRLTNSAKDIVGEKMREINDIRADYQTRFTILEDMETLIRMKENEHNEKEAHLANRLSNYMREFEDLQKKKRQFEKEVECIKQCNEISESRIVLNVGGIVYTTSVATVTKEQDSLLSMMFCGNHPLKKELDGTYFIDRDGVNFRFILNYLRDGPDAIDTLQKDDQIIKEVIIEAKYYKLGEMVRLLQEKLS